MNAVDGFVYGGHAYPAGGPGCLWWRRQPVLDLAGGGRVSTEVVEFVVLGFNADGVNVRTVRLEPGVVGVAVSCPDTESGIAWATWENKAHVFAGVNELVRELMDSLADGLGR